MPLFVTGNTRVLSRVQRTGEFSDARIRLTDGTVFHVHKVVLAQHSDYFRALFQSSPNQMEYLVQNVSASAFNHILAWIYKHEMSLNQRNVKTVLRESDYLACLEVVDLCEDFVRHI